jgi:hypothetical protein
MLTSTAQVPQISDEIAAVRRTGSQRQKLPFQNQRAICAIQ